jgi:hypothetical protein
MGSAMSSPYLLLICKVIVIFLYLHLVLHHSKFDGCYGHGVQSGQPIYMEDAQHAHEKISRDTQGR